MDMAVMEDGLERITIPHLAEPPPPQGPPDGIMVAELTKGGRALTQGQQVMGLEILQYLLIWKKRGERCVMGGW